ncbi:hypothetical protein CMQ_4108 [Grosmannia clavigera kw1407]|uniref:Uncharacterized protein n=1 Tax=Grosmannia clavigera (strain kw1407 / UAMH 11150) TaxID=655863 RepID=F0X9Q0_GROCL|nr:uncharacterized protein CMQ_4108 [Grosmannia clavigera kw1407]EFX06039.1 hypothetical protein CMQ_4108 [Grosmannia clavigera kw1407]
MSAIKAPPDNCVDESDNNRARGIVDCPHDDNATTAEPPQEQSGDEQGPNELTESFSAAAVNTINGARANRSSVDWPGEDPENDSNKDLVVWLETFNENKFQALPESENIIPSIYTATSKPTTSNGDGTANNTSPSADSGDSGQEAEDESGVKNEAVDIASSKIGTWTGPTTPPPNSIDDADLEQARKPENESSTETITIAKEVSPGHDLRSSARDTSPHGAETGRPFPGQFLEPHHEDTQSSISRTADLDQEDLATDSNRDNGGSLASSPPQTAPSVNSDLSSSSAARFVKNSDRGFVSLAENIRRSGLLIWAQALACIVMIVAIVAPSLVITAAITANSEVATAAIAANSKVATVAIMYCKDTLEAMMGCCCSKKSDCPAAAAP